MLMLKFSEFNKTGDIALDVYNALEYCKSHNEDGLIFDNKTTYDVYKEKSAEAFVSVSNHRGPRIGRVLFLLDGFKDFVLDGGGCHFVFNDIMFPIIARNSENLKIQNFESSSAVTMNFQAEVTESGSDWFNFKPITSLDVYTVEDRLYVQNKSEDQTPLFFFVERDKNTKQLVANAGDCFFGFPEHHISFKKLSGGQFSARNVKRKIPVGNTLVFSSRNRAVANIFIDKCVNTEINNVTLYSGMGMGVIAQNSDTITIDRFSTCLSGDRAYSINCDATHFVHCKGEIVVRNSLFEGQLDDALNIHSVYMQIVDKTEKSLLLKYMHPQAIGLDIINAGGEIEISDASTLIPYKTFSIKSVKKINSEYTEVFVDDSVNDVVVGDVANEISYTAKLLFEKNIVQKNRARGLLLGSAGKTIIRNNLFKTSGSAIKLESDGKMWFESGGTRDILISENTFYNCCYCSGWGTEVIETQEREKTEKNKFFHGKIEISDNTFENCPVSPAAINNVKELIFKNNKFINCESNEIKTMHCKRVEKS